MPRWVYAYWSAVYASGGMAFFLALYPARWPWGTAVSEVLWAACICGAIGPFVSYARDHAGREYNAHNQIVLLALCVQFLSFIGFCICRCRPVIDSITNSATVAILVWAVMVWTAARHRRRL